PPHPNVPPPLSDEERKRGLQGVSGITITFEDGKQRAADPAYVRSVVNAYDEAKNEAKMAEYEKKSAIAELEQVENRLQKAVAQPQRAEEKGKGELAQITRDDEAYRREIIVAERRAEQAVNEARVKEAERMTAQQNVEQIQRAAKELKERNDLILQEN